MERIVATQSRYQRTFSFFTDADFIINVYFTFKTQIRKYLHK